MYILREASMHDTFVIPRRLQKLDWKALRRKRLVGDDNDEIQGIKFLQELFVPCLHARGNGKGTCREPRHCRACFVNTHSIGFWQKNGCKIHPHNEDVASLLEMRQLRAEADKVAKKRERELALQEKFRKANNVVANVDAMIAEERRAAMTFKEFKTAGGNEFGNDDGNAAARAIPEEWRH